VEPVRLIHRQEVEAFLLRVFDMADDVSAIRQRLEENDDGEEEEAE
jgi:hypothetical protein